MTLYGIKGQVGYLHGACLAAYQDQHTVHDAQGRPVSIPNIEHTAEVSPGGNCLLCGGPLDQPARSP